MPGRPDFATRGPTDSLATAAPDGEGRRRRCRTSRASSSATSTTSTRLRADWTAGELDAVSGLPPARRRGLRGDRRRAPRPLPGHDAPGRDAQPAGPAQGVPGPRRAPGAARGDRPGRDRRDASSPGSATRADALIPPSSPMFDAAISPAVGIDVAAARKAPDRRRLEGRPAAAGSRRARRSRSSIEVLSPEEAANPVAYAAAAAVVARVARHRAGRAPGPAAGRASSSATACARGEFQVAVVPLAHRPRSRPLPAARRVADAHGRLERRGPPGPDARQAPRRGPHAGRRRGPQGGLRALQERLADRPYVLPLAFRDEVVVFRDTVVGPAIAAGRRPRGPLLGRANMAPRRRQ